MNKVAVIDLDSVIFSAAHPHKTYDAYKQPIKENGRFVYIDKTLEEMYIAADEIMKSILTATKATHYIAFVKGKGNFRKEIYPEYKANRGTQPPVWWNPLRDYFISRWAAIQPHGMEVDDAVNITRLQVKDSFICAIDGDLLGLKGTHYNWRKNEWITTSKEEADCKFWTDMIVGQPGDNIKGIPKHGPVSARNTLLESKPVQFKFAVLGAYVHHFGEEQGISEYYKNYKCLHILESHKDFEIPVLVEVSKSEEVDWI